VTFYRDRARQKHESLTVSEQQFLDVAAALRQFWEAFPERLYLIE
jgi:hypothetical protein